jgi:hypothetical protein
MELGGFSGRQALEAVKDIKIWLFMVMGAGIYVCNGAVTVSWLASWVELGRQVDRRSRSCFFFATGVRDHHHQVFRTLLPFPSIKARH